MILHSYSLLIPWVTLSKKSICWNYPDIMMFLEFWRLYRYISGVSIQWYLDMQRYNFTVPWAYHCIGIALCFTRLIHPLPSIARTMPCPRLLPRGLENSHTYDPISTNETFRMVRVLFTRKVPGTRLVLTVSRLSGKPLLFGFIHVTDGKGFAVVLHHKTASFPLWATILLGAK